MPFILGILAIIGAAYFWAQRAKNAGDMASELAEIPKDLMLAARRFGFKRRMNRHPVDDVEDRNLAIAAIATGFLELGMLPTQEDRQNLLLQTQSVLNVSKTDAEELIILGRWLLTQCGHPSSGIDRMARRLNKFAGADASTELLTLVQQTLGDDWNEDQLQALKTVQNAFNIR